MNEIKNHTVTGLHNWIWYYYNEGNMDKMHDIDYKGYMKSVLLGDVSGISAFFICNFTEQMSSFFFHSTERTTLEVSLFI